MTTAVMTNYLEQKYLEYILRSGTFASPASVYIALYTTTPDDSGGGTEVSGGNYARAQMTAGFNTPSNGATANTSEIVFPTSTEVWGEIKAIGIFDNANNGNLLFYGSLTSPEQVDIEDVFTIAAGDLDIALTGDVSTFLANKMLDHILNGTTFTQPTDAYIALYTTVPTVGDSGGVEVTGGSYARVQCFGSSDWDAVHSTGGNTANTNTKTFPIATADWGEIKGGAIRSANVAGDLYFVKTLTANKTIYNGDTFRFAAGAITITVS